MLLSEAKEILKKNGYRIDEFSMADESEEDKNTEGVMKLKRAFPEATFVSNDYEPSKETHHFWLSSETQKLYFIVKNIHGNYLLKAFVNDKAEGTYEYENPKARIIQGADSFDMAMQKIIAFAKKYI